MSAQEIQTKTMPWHIVPEPIKPYVPPYIMVEVAHGNEKDDFVYSERRYQKELRQKKLTGIPCCLTYPQPADRLANITHSLKFDTSVR